MSDRDIDRRNVLKTSAVAVCGGALAGCMGGSGSDGTEGGSETTGTDSGGPYSVTMEPVGTVEFQEPPERWFPYTGDYADMGVALGQGDGLLAVGIKDRFGTGYYEELPGVSVDESQLTQLWQDGTGKEVFYDLDADVHLIDPNFMINRIDWSQSDVDDIKENVAPFFGNTIFSGSYPWHEDYTYYSLYEAFEKVAQVFQEQERYQSFATLHDEVLEDVESRLPEQRPNVAVLLPKSQSPEEFYPYVIDSGTSFKQWNDLKVGDALAQSDVKDFHDARGTIDYETLLDIDPEVIAIRHQGKLTKSEFEDMYVTHMQDHNVASELQAVKNDRVIRGGMLYQGPIINLFQLEQAAQGLYTDEFGGEQLFDRQRVADIVTGDA